jgi:exopolysaccharide biosynthesis protein
MFSRTTAGWAGTVLVLGGGCNSAPVTVEWTEPVELNAALPDGVRVLEGVDFTLPLRLWAVRVEPGAASIEVVQSSDLTDNRETVASFAESHDACIAINGGYFSMQQTPAVHAGLLVEDGVVRAAATRNVTRESIRYSAVRAALGFDDQGVMDIEWVTSEGDTVFAWNVAPSHMPGVPGEFPGADQKRIWPVIDALSAGPLIVRDGRLAIATNGEVFFGSTIPDVHPRTAAGYTADGTVILLVVDGRQTQSRGVDLEELGRILIDLGAVEALNLDGGGSSTIVVGDRLLNRPGGGTTLRQVMSAIVVKC